MIHHLRSRMGSISYPCVETPETFVVNKPPLERAIDTARTFSPGCAQKLAQASIHLTNAQTELQAAVSGAVRQTYTWSGHVGQTNALLDTTASLLDNARAIAEQQLHPPEATPPAT
jgi:hypothetical protein